ncbi:MAG TPA: amidase [Chryseolinea sp.]|nr:amidase [Chryseolinea sp.]
MKRRQFLKASSASWLAITTFDLISCQNKSSITPEKAQPFALEEVTIDELQQKMQSGELSSRSITEMYLKRIETIDKNGVALNSVIELNPDAITIAEAMDKERKEGKVRSAMHGIPVLIKDNIDTGDKMMTTAGALALEGNRASKDAFIISQLRSAGAVVIGKTNLSEWANFRADRSSSGWSSRGGQTKNPYVLDRNPCGSSSGSGAAVAANLSTVAIGTETNGSIACPSSINGIVGIKPTVGLLSRSGIIPISKTQDTAGPMARTVKDAAIMLGALTGVDDEDSITQQSKGKTHSDYTSFLDPNGLKGKRIGVEKSMLKKHEGIDKLLQEALETMKANGATIVEVDLLGKLDGVSPSSFTVLQYEFKDGVNRYLAKANAPVKSLTQVIEFNRTNESTAMPFFKQDILESSDAKPGLDNKEYKDALHKILTITRGALDSTIKDHQLNAICGPTTGPSWCTDLINGDFFTGYGVYSSASIAGYPHITMPMGLVFDLPIGISFLGQPYQEPELLSISYAYEQASKKRTAPKFIASSR